MSTIHLPERLIGRYTGTKRGPLLIVLGGVHGNEPAGIQALELMFKMLEVEPITNPNFTFRGRIVGFRGNCQALALKQRYLQRDLNRLWTVENIATVKQTPIGQLAAEYKELKQLSSAIEQEIVDYGPEKIILLDLHTTTAFGGIFSIATDDPESLRIAIELHAPVVRGLLRGIQGTTLHYFIPQNFEQEVVAVCFESGQHNEGLSVNRAIAAITNCMRTIGCVRAEDVENQHDQLLIEYSRGLPKVNDLITCHDIKLGDDFRMEPGYTNFQPIKEGDLLAHDKDGPIYAISDGLILMPLYQKQGEDGFFLIHSAKGF